MSNLMKLRMRYETKQITSEEYDHSLVERTADILESEREFKILDFLGSGTYGYVISAVCPDYENEIAVKITRAEKTREDEINLWPLLEHENILPVFESNTLQYVNIFITPKMNKDLEVAVAEDDVRYNPLGLNVVKSWLRNTLSAVAYLHENSLCHLDIKADNVFIDFDSTAKLGDFSFLQSIDNPVKKCGAPLLYRPPISESEKNSIDGLAFDIWCCGIMALNVLTQHRMTEDMKSIEKKTFDWYINVYPILYEELQIDRFRSLMSDALPSSSLKDDFEDALDFILSMLKMQPSDRPTARQVLDHVFLMKGSYRCEKIDSIWKSKSLQDTVCSARSDTGRMTLRQRKRQLHRYKYRYRHIAISHHKWKKMCQNGKVKKVILNEKLDDQLCMSNQNSLKDIDDRKGIVCHLQQVPHEDLKKKS